MVPIKHRHVHRICDMAAGQDSGSELTGETTPAVRIPKTTNRFNVIGIQATWHLDSDLADYTNDQTRSACQFK